MAKAEKRILIIETELDLRYFLQQALSSAGFRVDTVDRGADGLKLLLTEEFHMAMINLDMPEISGANICRALRKHDQTRDLPLVMISNRPCNPETSEQEKKGCDADEFLFKPITGIDLENMLERVFKHRPKRSEQKEQPIRDFTIPILLHRFYMEKATGLLHLNHSSAKKVVYIKDGYPIFTRSNVLNECLGRMLVKEGRITQVDCDQSVDLSRASGRLQGTELIGMGLLTPKELHEALIHQVTEKLLSTFSWRNGTWQFIPGKDFKRNVTRIQLTPATLISQGIERFWTTVQLDDYLAPFRSDYLKQSEDPQYRFQDVELSKRGQAILKSCRGIKTLEQLLDDHPLARREVQKILSALLISELVERHTLPQQVAVDDVDDEGTDKVVDSKLRSKILEDYQRIVGSNYFVALGIAEDASSADARRTYYRLAKEYHPDRYLGGDLSREMSAKINEIFQYITQAYSVLSDPDTRARYVEELHHGPAKKLDINQIIEAEGAYQEGRALTKIRHYSAAAKVLKRAIELSPEEPEYMTSYAWALFKSDPDKERILNQALEILLAARELNAQNDKTHLYLGHVYHALRKDRQAEKSFEMAVQANPDCTEALRELRLLNLRREQVPQGKGLFSKFLKKD